MNTKNIVKRSIGITFILLFVLLILPNFAFARIDNDNDPGGSGGPTINQTPQTTPWYQKPLCTFGIGSCPDQQTSQTTQTSPTTAYSYNKSEGIKGLLDLLGSWLKALFPIIIALALVWFIWNIFRYVIASNEEDKGNAKKDMVWGIVAIFVMVSIWGLVVIIQVTFKVSGVTGSPQIINNIITPLAPPKK